MKSGDYINRLLCGIVLAFFLWFFASSLSIAYHRAPTQDDAMFATIPKNFLNGYGWATSYGEKIPFNPDISTGPTLLLPAMALIAMFGNQTWAPAMTGTLTNILLTLGILWQLWLLSRNRAATFLALLLSVSIYAVGDFKTFTGYYSCSLLFVFSLLFSLNTQYSFAIRSMMFGALAAVGLYGKPLIFLSFLIALPCIMVFECGFSFKRNGKYFLIILASFLFIFTPWQIYKKSVLSGYGGSFQSAYKEYDKKFFEYHGTGIGQFKEASDKLVYLKNNTRKNYRILNKFLKTQNNFPIYILPLVAVTAIFIFIRHRTQKISSRFERIFPAILALVILGNLFWYIIFSFAMTPGHAFFLTFFSFLLLFFLIAAYSPSNIVGMLFCIVVAAFFQVRIPPLIEAYQFKAADIIDNEQVKKTLLYLQTHKFQYPLASCGYVAAPHRMEYLLPASQNFVDCYNVLEDSLEANPSGTGYSWREMPNFTFAIEGLSFLAAARSQSYVLGPIIEACQKHILFNEGIFIVCEVRFDEIKEKLDPTETAKQLDAYQQWYRTRIK